MESIPIIITSRTDLDVWIANVRPDVEAAGLAVALGDAIQAAEHPRWGSDWAEWLAAHVDELVTTVANTDTTPAPAPDPEIIAAVAADLEVLQQVCHGMEDGLGQLITRLRQQAGGAA